MCGIVSIISKKTFGFSYKEKEMFKQMLTVDVLRGEDSTGMYVVNKYGNVEWCKDKSTPLEFLEHSDVKEVLSETIWTGRAMVGHNRKATKGTINDENAHPFVENNIILVHNGTLTNHKDLNKDVEVDSHAIVHAINDHGIEKAIGKIDGAFACIAYDANVKKVYVFRNKERPLWYIEDDSCYYFASEPWMIFGMAWRNQIRLELKDLKEVEIGKLYSFDIDEKEETKLIEKKVKLIDEVKTALVPVKVTPITTKQKKTKIDNFIEKFVSGNNIIFKPQSIERNVTGTYIHGVHWTDPSIRVRCSLKFAKPEYYMKQELLCGTVTGISYNANTSSKYVFCKDVTVSVPLTTINGVEINEEMFQDLSGECTKCKNTIEEEELEESFLKCTGKRTIHLCPKCVSENLEKNPLWGGIIKNEVKSLTLH